MKIKKDWLIGGLFFILFIIAYELRYYWAKTRQIPSEAGALVYRTGSGKEITVDLSSEVILLKEHYLLKKSSIQEIPFARISSARWSPVHL